MVGQIPGSDHWYSLPKLVHCTSRESGQLELFAYLYTPTPAATSGHYVNIDLASFIHGENIFGLYANKEVVFANGEWPTGAEGKRSGILTTSLGGLYKYVPLCKP